MDPTLALRFANTAVGYGTAAEFSFLPPPPPAPGPGPEGGRGLLAISSGLMMLTTMIFFIQERWSWGR